MSSVFPINFEDIRRAQKTLEPHLVPTPFRTYEELNEFFGDGTRIYVKHENFQPTNSFKIRNAFSAMSDLNPDQRTRGIVAATRGNHGLGLAYAGKKLGVNVTICVPHNNNPEKNSGMRALGALVLEEGDDYDQAIENMQRLSREKGLTEIHSTNCKGVIAGAGTMSTEMLESVPDLDALVIAVGGGSQVVGAIVAAREMSPKLKIYGVQADGAAAVHDSWHKKSMLKYQKASTIADGLATRSPYEMTFSALVEGLHGFVTVTDHEICKGVRAALRYTHSLVEPAGAAGLAGAFKLRNVLAGKRVGIAFSGGNIDYATLKNVLG